MEFRRRPLSETLSLARLAGSAAGVTRVSDVTGFGVSGIPVFQATRPASRSLAVSQGKGLTPAAAIVGALLEAAELWSAERLERPEPARPLTGLSGDEIRIWSSKGRDEFEIELHPDLPRAWLPGEDLSSGRPCRIPWDLLSLDFTRDNVEYVATSNGLACGNSREEALVSGISELIEHHFVEQFHRMPPRQRRASQVAIATIEDRLIRRLLALVEAAGFEVRAWSLAGDFGLPVLEVTLFEAGHSIEDMTPVGGNGCYPDARVAFVRALLEAVQTRAALVAGARDDLTPDEYGSRRERNIGLLLGTYAFNDGPLAWSAVPHADCASTGQCLDFLIERVGAITPLPIVAFDHPPPCPGLHIVHVIAPGLMDDDRGPRLAANARPSPAIVSSSDARPPPDGRIVLFAGPSISGLCIPAGIEVRPPAKCGDLAGLLAAPPAAVGLVDGLFKLAPTVWHKEILSLLALGVRVLGGASLGALRAVELERFGMEGIGAIFNACRSGAMLRDDAVMLVHAPAELDYAPLSVPLVDAEYILASLELPPPALRTMQRIVRTTPFETRDWPLCLQQFRDRTGGDFPVTLARLQDAPSLKRMDAALLIEALAQLRVSALPQTAMPPLTCHFRAMLAKSAPAFAASLILPSQDARPD